MASRRVRRTVVLGGLFAAGVGIGRGLARRHEVVRPVPHDLRDPSLYLPLSVRDERTLRIGRALLSRAPNPVEPGVEVSDRTIPGGDGPAVGVHVYETPGRDRPSGALVWIHGGGLIMGRADRSHPVCSRLASQLGILVVSVEYRLAPDHPFPAGLDDCMAALAWVHAEADALGIDPARVAVGGDSAGGGLAAAVSQRAHDEGGPPIALQALVYPMLDDRTTGPDLPTTLVWTPTSNRYAWGAYLGHPPGQPEDRPHAVPARRDDLTGLAPAWIGVGDVDLFHDEDVDYARRLTEAGVPCELHVVRGMYHGADVVAANGAASVEFRARLAAALDAAVGSGAAVPA